MSLIGLAMQPKLSLIALAMHEATTFLVDNQSAIAMAISDGPRQRTKHIDVRAKWLTDRVGKKVIQLKHIPGTEQVADILTKPLQKTRFETNRKLLFNFSLLLSILSVCLTVSNSEAYFFYESAPVFYELSMVRFTKNEPS